MKPFEIVEFKDGDFTLNINVSLEEETVWLNKGEIAQLFERDRSVIGKHINNIFKLGELEKGTSCAKFAHKIGHQTYYTDYYNLDVIVLLGYRIKSNRGTLLRDFLNDYFMSLSDVHFNDNSKIIIFNNGEISLSVNVSLVEDTVYLNETQIATLFETSRQNINLHIKNILKEGELSLNSVRKDFLHTAVDGKKYKVAFYNLDMILSVGYRVKSSKAIEFRKWATSVLKELMINGYIIYDKRCLECQNSILDLKNRVLELEDRSLLFLPGEVERGYMEVKALLESAKEEIIIIDNYFGHKFDDVLTKVKVKVTIITNIKNKKIESSNIYKVVKTNNEHDRFLIIDNTCYHFGSSFETLGDKRSLAHKIKDSYLIDALKKLQNP